LTKKLGKGFPWSRSQSYGNQFSIKRRVRLTNGPKVDTCLQELELDVDEFTLALGGECECVSIGWKGTASRFSGGVYGLSANDPEG